MSNTVNEQLPEKEIVEQPTNDPVDLSPELDIEEDDSNERLEWYNSNPDLEEFCTANGLTRKQFLRRCDRITSLEMFLGFWPTMQSVRFFGLLQHLSIVKHPTIATIEGINACPFLETLHITECSLMRIQNLDNCTKLTQLNLSSNHLEKIEGLSFLSALEVLWLNDNQISIVEGLSSCVHLKQLWLAKNAIETLDTSLDHNQEIQDINLAANRLNSFQTLGSLHKLPLLRSLSLSDPHFGDNPVCRLCNYQTYLLCRFPTLSYLDTIELSSSNKQVADTTLTKKRMYYNMRIKTIKRHASDCIRSARTCYSDHINYANFNLNALMRELSDLEKELHADKTSPFPQYAPGALATKRDRIHAHIQQKMRTVHAMTTSFEALVSRVALLSEKTIQRLMLELHTGGNIRLEDGKPSDVWYVSCVDLVKSRSFVHDMQLFGVAELKVNRVTRINHRYLRNRFQERMEEIVDGPEEQVKDNVSKRGITVKDTQEDRSNIVAREDIAFENGLEYLFYMQPPILDHMSAAQSEQDFAIQAGLRPLHEYVGVADSGIKLTNSLAALDLPRLATSLHVKGQDRIDPVEITKLDQFGWDKPPELSLAMRSSFRKLLAGDWRLPNGHVLIAKVFLGRVRQVDSVPCAKDHMDGIQCIQVAKPSDPKQRCYYLLDEALILPEYLVEYEYILEGAIKQPVTVSPRRTNNSSDEALADMAEAFAITEGFQAKYKLTFAEPLLDQHLLEETTKALIQMEPTTPRRQTMGMSQAITPAFILDSSRQKELSNICELNLTSCGLKSLQGFENCNLTHLETLILSFNELRRIECLDGLKSLKFLDFGYNILRSLDNVSNLVQLKTLLLNNNLLYRFEDVRSLSHLQVHTLDMRNNAICDAKRYRLHVIQKLPQLTTLDMGAVTQVEAQAARELCLELTPLKIWACSRGKHLYNHSSALEIYQTQYLKRKPREMVEEGISFDEDGSWWKDVDELHVNHELLTKLTHLDKLRNLRIASFSDNDITYIDGLSQCAHLEELIMENNQIMSIENLESLVNLKVLDLSKNKLTSMKNLDALVNLKQLSVEDNEITSLQGLSHLVRLMELYVGNNRISYLKEIQHLKTLPKLIIVDFAGNGFCSEPEYQLYTIYHLRRIKVLDGSSITAELQNEAKQAYSGKLTTDFLVEKIGHAFNRIQEMELSSCRIREIGSLHGDVFVNLRDLNLENNLISDISGLEKLPKLRVLNLSSNKIDRLTSAGPGTGILACPKLEVLQLARNLIADMVNLSLQHVPELKILNLEANDITSIVGLAALRELKELYLSKNKIRQFDPQPGANMSNLVLLKLDDNSLRTLMNFLPLQRLQVLDLSNNRLADMEEVERLHHLLPILQEMSLLNNPLCKRHLARSTIIFRFPTLKTLDGRDITLEERERVDVLFMHDRSLPNPTLPPSIQASPMANSNKASVKLTAMSFDALAANQSRKSQNNNGVTLFPQVPQQQMPPQGPGSTRDEKDKSKDDAKEVRRKNPALPDTLLSNHPMNSGLSNMLTTSFASFSQTKGMSRPGDAMYSSNSIVPPKPTYLAQPTGHVLTNRSSRNHGPLK
ncbi:hypothetical protein AeRB84_003209 [Aphanomyces euteiches]|nr:hypothetical protein AeRB84_003209 [Aphanomyces euteiches]